MLFNAPVEISPRYKAITRFLQVQFTTAVVLFAFSAMTGIASAEDVKLIDNVPLSTAAGMESPNFGIVSPDGKHLYVTSLGSPGTVGTYRLITKADSTKGNFDTLNGSASSLIAVANDGLGGGAWDVAMSKNGIDVYVSTYNGNSILHFKRIVNDNKANYGSLALADTYNYGQNGLNALLGPRGLAISPDGRSLAVATLEGNALIQFAIDSDGKLSAPQSFVDSVTQTKDGVTINGLSGANDVVYSADGRNIYVVAQNDNAVTVFTRDAIQQIPDTQNADKMIDNPNFGVLSFQGSINDADVPSLYGASSIQVDNNDNVYVSGAVSGDVPGALIAQVVHFKRDMQETIIVQQQQTNPDTKQTETVPVTEANPAFGHLLFVATNDFMSGKDTIPASDIVDLQLDKDKAFLMASSYDTQSIKVYRRETLSGYLHPVQEVMLAGNSDGNPSVANDIVLSPDGNSFYTIDTNHGISHFKTSVTADLSLTFNLLSQGSLVVNSLENLPKVTQNGVDKIKVLLVPTTPFDIKFNMTNHAANDASDVMFATLLPEQIHIDTAMVGADNCQVDGQHVVCSVATLASEKPAVVELKGEVLAAGELNLGVEVLSSDREQDYTDNIITQDIVFDNPPIAVDDTVVNYNLPIDVLANDSDPDKQVISIQSFDAQTAKGGAVTHTEGSQYLVYTPPPDNFDGQDSFTYTIADSLGATATAAVNITNSAKDKTTSNTSSSSQSSGSSSGSGSEDYFSLILSLIFLLTIRIKKQNKEM